MSALDPQAVADEIEGRLDELASDRVDVRRHAAARLARLGVWHRGSTRPRGFVWASPSVALPRPERLFELLAAANDPDPAVQSQVIAALGHWGDESVAPTIAAKLATTSDESIRLYCVGALRALGGPTAVAALIDVIRADMGPVARAALHALEALFTGGPVDDTSAPSTIRQPPAEGRDGFTRLVEEIAAALSDIVIDESRQSLHTKATDVLALVEPHLAAPRVARVTARRFEEFTREVEAVPAAPVGSHLSSDDMIAFAIEELSKGDRARSELHLRSCVACASDVDALVTTMEALLTRARVTDALAQLSESVNDSAVRHRLTRWLTEAGARAQGAVRVILEVPKRTAQVLTTNLEGLLVPDPTLRFDLEPLGVATRGVPVRAAGVPPDSPAPGALARARGDYTTTVTANAAGRVTVTVDDWPGDKQPPLVLFVNLSGTEPAEFAQLNRVGPGERLTATIEAGSGDWIVAFEPR